MNYRDVMERCCREFGSLCQSSREGMGMSRESIARRAGVSVGTVTNFEQGNGIPRADVVFAILSECGYTLEDMAVWCASEEYQSSE